ncbi:MAG: ATP-binding protein, partial [Sciscionella sp.]
MRTPNPYRPGFNQVPAVLAGRDDILAGIDEALDVAALDARTPRPVMITGTRGVGKTVVLDQARRTAALEHSWLSAAIEVQPGLPFLPTLRAAIDHVHDAYAQHRPSRGRWKLTKTTLKAGASMFGAEAELTRAEPLPPGTLREALDRLMGIVLPLDAGLLITTKPTSPPRTSSPNSQQPCSTPSVRT